MTSYFSEREGRCAAWAGQTNERCRRIAPGRKTAKVHYGAKGWVVHTISNIWGYTSPGEHPSWGQFPCAGAWLRRTVYFA